MPRIFLPSYVCEFCGEKMQTASGKTRHLGKNLSCARKAAKFLELRAREGGIGLHEGGTVNKVVEEGGYDSDLGMVSDDWLAKVKRNLPER